MSSIPKVGIRELRANLADYLKSRKPIAIVRHGQTLGYYVPIEEIDGEKMEVSEAIERGAIDEKWQTK